MQDFTGVPCIVDLATMREAVGDLGGDPTKINPLAPAELVIDHSVIADLFGTENALERNVEIEYERNGERYQFLRWGQTAFDDFKVVPPGTGIVHQVNIEYLARVDHDPRRSAASCRPTPTPASAPTRTPRWSTASACSAGASAASRPRRPCSASRSRCSSRKVVGFKLTGAIPTGVTATDVVLTITEHAAQARRGRQVRRVLRDGRGRRAARQPRHHRQHEPGVRLDGRHVPDRRRHPRLPAPHRPQRRAGRPRRGVLQAADASGTTREREPVFSEYLELDLATVVPSIAGPKRPQDRIELSEAKAQFEKDLDELRHVDHDLVDAAVEGTFPASDPPGLTPEDEDSAHELHQRRLHVRERGRRATRSRPRSTCPTADDVHARPRPVASRRSPPAPTPRTRR